MGLWLEARLCGSTIPADLSRQSVGQAPIVEAVCLHEVDERCGLVGVGALSGPGQPHEGYVLLEVVRVVPHVPDDLGDLDSLRARLAARGR